MVLVFRGYPGKGQVSGVPDVDGVFRVVKVAGFDDVVVVLLVSGDCGF